MHKSVLLQEAIMALNIKPDGIYVDATFGRGGHSQEILKHLNAQGRLIIFDQDPAAIEYAHTHFGKDPRVRIVSRNFEFLKDEVSGVDGILFDLGVSSPQLEEAERGFSFLKAGPLDMRMNPQMGPSAADILKAKNEKELAEIFKTYGEERFAKQIARAIINQRSHQTLNTTQELAHLIEETIPKRFHETHKHPATRSFQALRILVNRELDVLQKVLDIVPSLLNQGGRAVFISFHSLEDRLVKQKLFSLCNPAVRPRKLPLQESAEDLPHFKLCIKMKKAEAAEIQDNPRARSAVLRVMERIR